MRKPKLVVMAAHGAATFSPLQRAQLRQAANVQFVAAAERISEPQFIRTFRHAEIAGLTPRGTPALTAKLLAALPRLRSIAIPTTGFDWLNVSVAAKHGIKICHVPNFCSDSAAEFAWGLILGLGKKIGAAQEWLRTGKKRLPHFKGMELKDKTLGIIGTGAIGTRVARIGLGFGLRVLSHDSKVTRMRGVKAVALRSLLRQSDIVSIHVPLNPTTQHLLCAASLRQLKKGALLVNIARPGLIAQRDVLESLRTGRLGGYAYDIGYSARDYEERLIQHPQVLAVPHIAWYTAEALEREIAYWVAELVALAHGHPKHAVAMTQDADSRP